MQVKSLITCANSVMAENIKQLLSDEGIDCTIEDQTVNKAVAFGANTPGYEIRVSEEDYDRAKEIADSIEEERNEMMPWCPECGSEDVYYELVKKKHYSGLPFTVMGAFAGLVYLICVKQYAEHIFPVWFLVVILAAMVACIAFLFKKAKPKVYEDKIYHCRKCGKVFERS